MTTDRSLISINGEALAPDPLGGLYWPREETLIVSDLHFEKGSSFAAKGVMLPPYDTRTTLLRLSALTRRYGPKRIISLGDAFHDGEAEARMAEEDAALLEALMAEAAWTWVLGNHDPEPPQRFAAETVETLTIGSLSFRHEPLAGPAAGEIAGHLHPCARVSNEGRILRRRCFAVGGGPGEERVIMPAMGAYTGGLNVLDEAYDGLFEAVTAWVMGADGVYPIARSLLAPEIGLERRRAG